MPLAASLGVLSAAGLWLAWTWAAAPWLVPEQVARKRADCGA